MRGVTPIVLVLLLSAGCLTTPPAEPVPATPPPTMDDPTLSQTGRWSAPFDGLVPAVNMVLLADGRILYWSGVEARPGSRPMDQVFVTTSPYVGESRILELGPDGPIISEPINALGDGEDLFCSGQTMLPDGRILVAGGTTWYEHTQGQAFFLEGTPDARIFDPATDTWSRMEEMRLNRWYPTVLTGPDGHAIAASGIGSLTDQEEHWANWERFDEEWRILSGTDGHLLPLYPHLHVLPSGPLAGHAMYSATGTLWGPFGEHRDQGEWSSFKSYDIAHDAWHEHGLSQYGARNYATSTMLPIGPGFDETPTVLTAGGTLQQTVVATALTELIDASTDPPTSTRGPDMLHARWNHQSVLLPTGDFMVVGGGTYDNVVVHGQDNVPIMEAELWRTSDGAWQELAAMSVPRMYHSTAVLLPDGRVLVGGHVPLPDDLDEQVVERRLEIYEPGYLFRGARPIIEDAPGVAQYGETIDLAVTFNGTIESVMLMRPGTTTHAYDSNARAISLPFDSDNGVLQVALPTDPIVSAPGPHMIFVNGAHPDGAVPSEAAWVTLETGVIA